MRIAGIECDRAINVGERFLAPTQPEMGNRLVEIPCGIVGIQSDADSKAEQSVFEVTQSEFAATQLKSRPERMRIANGCAFKLGSCLTE